MARDNPVCLGLCKWGWPLDHGKGGSDFGFSRRGHDVSRYLRYGVDGSVVGRAGGWWVTGLHGLVTEEEVASRTDTGMRL